MSVQSGSARYQESQMLWEESRELMPDGVAGDAQFWAPFPIFFDRAEGALMWDVDGNEYLDFLCGNGAILLGHSHPAVVDTLKEFIGRWSPNLTPNRDTLELARLINKYIPSMQKLRFVPSASEAVHLALRVARAYTGRPKVGKVEGGFHGQVAEGMVATFSSRGLRGSAERPNSYPSSGGLDPSTVENTILFPWNDPESAVAIIEAHADELAGIVVEPVLGVGGAIAAEGAYLKALREVAEKHEIIFILDETVTGFRFSLGGVQENYQITPDLTVLGKVIGGGLPLAVFGGSDEVMKVVGRGGGQSPLTQAHQSGTFSGFSLGCAAGAAVLRALEDGTVHAHVNRLGEMTRDGLREISRLLGEPMQVTGVGPMFNAFFTDRPVRDARDAHDVDPGKRKGTEVHNRLLEKGIRALRNHFSLISYSHTEDDVTRLLTSLEEVLREMRTAS